MYVNEEKLCTCFPDILIMALSATITNNILEYIRESLHLQTSIHLYKQTLNRPNISYIVKEIKEREFNDLTY